MGKALGGGKGGKGFPVITAHPASGSAEPEVAPAVADGTFVAERDGVKRQAVIAVVGGKKAVGSGALVRQRCAIGLTGLYGFRGRTGVGEDNYGRL